MVEQLSTNQSGVRLPADVSLDKTLTPHRSNIVFVQLSKYFPSGDQ